MKSVFIISAITFVLIFGGVAGVSSQLNTAASGSANSGLTAKDYAAAERVFHDLAVERDRIQRDKEELLALRQSIVVQEQELAQRRESLMIVSRKLEQQQGASAEERERSATKLARIYEAMKPKEAAPLISDLEMDIILDIMMRMKDRQAANVLVRMDAGLAARVSTHMSLRGTG